MNTTVQALLDLYVKLGGSLTDTYEAIADGEQVGNYTTIPDCIEAITNKAGSGGGSALPAVTGLDDDSVLTVVNGTWDKKAPDNLIRRTYEFGFDVTVGQSESELIVTPNADSTYANISAALLETPNVYAVIYLNFQNQIIRALFSIDANGSGVEAKQALALIWNGTKFMGARLAVAQDNSCDLIVRET